jgi:hypothetical protein
MNDLFVTRRMANATKKLKTRKKQNLRFRRLRNEKSILINFSAHVDTVITCEFISGNYPQKYLLINSIN